MGEVINKKRMLKDELEEKLQNETGKTVEEYNSERFEIEKRIDILEKTTEDFKFLENYNEIESQLIELSSTISDKLSICDRLKKELSNYEKSYQLEFDADIE